MKLNPQKDKYKAFGITKEADLRKMAKGYGYELPKNIRNVSYYAKRLGNFIETKQFTNYNENLGINAGKITFTQIKNAEKQFRNSFKNAPDIEKEVFINNKTAYFLDKDQVSAPLTFHNFQNKKEYDEVMNSINPSQREQYKKDYMNNLKYNNRKEANERLGVYFNQKKQQFYDIKNLNWTTAGGNRVLNDLFNSLDYVRKSEMLNIMDTKEYELIVESLVKQGYSEPFAMEIALKNLGFRPDIYYQFTD